MDFLTAVPEEINNEILKYLNVKDIYNASCVSKQWYQIIGKSKICMGKIKIKYDTWNCCNDLKPLLGSKRQYQYFKIDFRSGDFTKNANIQSNVKAILKKFSKSIVGLNTSHDFQRVCELPKLNELIFFDTYIERSSQHVLYLNGLLDKYPSIEKFTFVRCFLDKKSSKVLLKVLQNAKKLKILKINARLFEDCQPSEYNFKLECLHILANYRNVSFDFIIAHKSTLKTIITDFVTFENLKILLSSFPNLQKLQFSSISDSAESVEFIQNTTIKKLTAKIFHSSYELGSLLIKQKFINLLSNLKSLQTLTVYTLSGDLLPVIFSLPLLVKVNFSYYSNDFTEAQKTLIETNDRIVFTKTSY